MMFPIRPVRMPACLADQTNGQLDPRILRPIGLGKMVLVEPAARSFKAMFAAAWSNNIQLSATGALRTYDAQVALFTTRYTTTPLPGRPTKVWNGVTYWQKPGTAEAAVPGTSNHGWGLAVDFARDADGVNDYETPIPMDKRTIDWLLANAAKFGWSWELQSEPWHLRYVDGDNIPQAVLDFEQPEQEELSMLTLDYQPNTPQWVAMLTTGVEIAHIVNGRANDVWRSAGVKRVTVARDQLLGILQTTEKVGPSPFAPGHPWSDTELHKAWIS
jgi:hypothetical protein